MRINYNVSAAIANKHLLGIEDNLSASMERLSSGLKINHSKDNPAGMAISNKMKAQIDGLNRASQNASDGISVIQIADGALSETTSILQRMRELSVQAASDATMTPADKEAIQKEITSLKDEVDRISTDTEYNSKSLLDGSLDTRVYTKNATRVDISDHVKAGQYQLSIDTAATQAGPVTANQNYNSTAAIGASGTMSINGSKVEIEATDTYAEAFEKIRNAAETGETAVKVETNGALSFTSERYGASATLEIAFDNQQIVTALGFTGVVEDPENKGSYVYGQVQNGKVIVPSGTDAEVTLKKPGDGTGFGDTATWRTDGNKITVTDRAGFEMSFLADAGYTGNLDFDVTDIGTMALHIGANEDQETKVRIPEVSCKSLYIDDADVTTVNGAGRGITQFDDAISKVSEVRSRLGAYQNRLESTVSSLDTFEENMTGAQSRLTDADMASEMTDYTHQNVLNQAAISVLTQANDLPQQVLQILQ
ncbi:flagellin [Roseburia sp. AM23-20]|jgi:flagellin|uniref:flagellin N-terminal helical domain-containing protein n=1 Tax=Roseburia sp. AM23-20 TaxID=2292066 RepID=UPI000E47D9CD|nr:flagellin [Roseburia sp. AM23-20]RHF94182.1 flagellin [Roseburia sp. AM23-20]